MTVDFPTPPLPLATPIYLTSLAKIEVDNLDFVENQEDLGKIIDKIDAQINGLF